MRDIVGHVSFPVWDIGLFVSFFPVVFLFEESSIRKKKQTLKIYFVHACNVQKSLLVFGVDFLSSRTMFMLQSLFYISLSEIYFNKTNIKTECLENKCVARDMLTKYAINVVLLIWRAPFMQCSPHSQVTVTYGWDTAEKTLLQPPGELTKHRKVCLKPLQQITRQDWPVFVLTNLLY